MANRRLGGGMGGGGPPRGPRAFSQQHHQPFQRNTNVSPWQGNMNMPSNNSMNQNGGGLLGQLASNPQQLALALTNLLQPQQQQMNNPPSLLSLNTAPAFSHQDNSYNRFGNNRGAPRSDFRRNEPYNKNRNVGGQWRNDQKNNLGGNNRNNNRNFNNRDNNRRNRPKPKDDTKRPPVKQEKPKPAEKKEKDEKKVEKTETVQSSNENVNAGEEESHADTKRDWKEEKNTEEVTIKEEEPVSQPIPKKAKEDRDGKYQGVPAKFLHCFVCNKDMWDGQSFQKHILGHAHKQMLQSLEESFHITVNILRENMRLAEEKKVIELNRVQRLNRNKFNRKFQEPESHCNMCDLKFLGKIVTHRKTEGHQRLKRFLHPHCDVCAKEFPGRMDWVDHRLTPEHLRKLAEKLAKSAGKEEGNPLVEDELEVDIEPLLDESIEMEVEHPILELNDDLVNFQSRMPAFKRTRAIGGESLKAFTGFLCEICHKSFENETLAQGHLKTQGHYYNFVEAVKRKFKRQTEAADREAKKRKREELEKEEKEVKEEPEVAEVEEEQNGNDMYDPEEACNEEEQSENVEEEEEAENEAEGEEEVNENENLAVKEAVEESENDKKVEELEELKEVEVKQEVESPAPVVRRTRVRRGAVNTPAPRGKKARKM